MKEAMSNKIKVIAGYRSDDGKQFKLTTGQTLTGEELEKMQRLYLDSYTGEVKRVITGMKVIHNSEVCMGWGVIIGNE
jgi:uncharacterized protein YnzC (UPF0291/DUF896 family)